MDTITYPSTRSTQKFLAIMIIVLGAVCGGSGILFGAMFGLVLFTDRFFGEATRAGQIIATVIGGTFIAIFVIGGAITMIVSLVSAAWILSRSGNRTQITLAPSELLYQTPTAIFQPQIRIQTYPYADMINLRVRLRKGSSNMYEYVRIETTQTGNLDFNFGTGGILGSESGTTTVDDFDSRAIILNLLPRLPKTTVVDQTVYDLLNIRRT
jgi:hypothetical protein